MDAGDLPVLGARVELLKMLILAPFRGRNMRAVWFLALISKCDGQAGDRRHGLQGKLDGGDLEGAELFKGIGKRFLIRDVGEAVFNGMLANKVEVDGLGAIEADDNAKSLLDVERVHA
jgi:hypothetical protein